MSSLIAPITTPFAQDLSDVDGGLDVVGQQGVENVIDIKGDAELGVVGGKLADTISTGAGDAIVFGGDGDDVITAGIGNDILRGGKGDDVIMGGKGDDTILGGKGDDTIKGGMGSDFLKGGSGDDVFQFGVQDFADGAVDEIADFEPGELADVIKIFGAADATVAYNPETGMVSVDGQDVIDVGENLDIEATKNDNDTWELF